ncbi:zinc finger protein 346 isoform X2 [Herrania umbratica]|uniref:Zinc finger protein 346 isoform X2 n=1 Tax=Herrania umbratica TaxID=108875 RepID=A0A6J1AIF4_9ROSI|nr:zinc finger protein 346 isoform X2 [Herrania umbratica]
MSQSHRLQQSSFTYLADSPNSLPNTLLPFPQPTSLLSQPLLFPPGTDPYAHSGLLTSPHVEFEAHAQFHDPNVGQSWITRQADPIKYDTTSLANDVIGSAPNETKLLQPVRCEVCNVDCNTKDVYEKHLMGKKHQRNWQAKTNLTTVAFPETSNTINNVSIVGQAGDVGGQMIFEASGVANGQELEKKKQKLLNAGAAVDSVRTCTICNVACNSHEVFSKHLSGRRHASQAGLISVNGIGPYLAAIRANDHFWSKGKKPNKVNQSAWCEVCQINCNSNDVYAKHLSGRKHLKNLEKSEKSKNGTGDPPSTGATNLVIGPVENPVAKKSSSDNVQKSEKKAEQPEAPKEDLEMKKRKVMEGGAAAAAVRVCTICNVVCNSQKVFNYHLTGQKHTAMVKKQADARISTATPQTNPL